MSGSSSTTNGCVLRIRSAYPSLTAAMQKAADYILSHPQEVVGLSISDLAAKSGVSEFTIVKLCRALSYKGYTDFRLKLASDNASPLAIIHERIEESDSALDVARKICASHTHALESTLRLQDKKVLEQAVDALASADTVLFLGFGGSACVAFDAEQKFFKTGIKCKAISDGHMQAMQSSLLTSRDVVVAFSNTGNSRELVDNLNVAKQAGARVIAVTSRSRSPVARAADIVICVSAVETAYHKEPMEVRVAQIYIVDVLFAAVALRKTEQVLANLQKIRQSLSSKRIEHK